MDDAARDPVPQATTAGEYVGLLRDVRRRSGLTYRDISRRAAAAGHWLPPSTLATLLGRTTLPRERTVVALLVACGTPAADIERWVAMRRDLEARLSERTEWHRQPSDPAPVSPAARTPMPADPAPASPMPGTAAIAGPTVPGATPPGTGRAGNGPAPLRRSPAGARRGGWSARRQLGLTALALVGALAGGASVALLPDTDGANAVRFGGGNLASAGGCPLVLRQGMYGPCVLTLQQRLVAGGLPVPVDGWFGPETTSRVMALQALVGLPVSGTVDAQVLDELSGAAVVPPGWPEDRIGRLLRTAFPEDPAGAVGLARCLSGLDPYRVEVLADGSRRWGLFQFGDVELSRLGVDRRTALDPGWSIGAAREVWSRTGDFGHWRCVP